MVFDNLSVSFEHDWQWASIEHFVFCENTNVVKRITIHLYKRVDTWVDIEDWVGLLDR